MRSPFNLSRFIVLLLVLFLAAAGAPARAEFQKRWNKNLGEYFHPKCVTYGEFVRDRGQEIVVLDTQGIAYFLQWKNNTLDFVWITTDPVAAQPVAAAAADLDDSGEQEIIIADSKGRITIMGADKKNYRILCRKCMPESYDDFKASYIAPAQADGDDTLEILLVGVMDDKTTAVIAELAQDRKLRVRKTSRPNLPRGELLSFWPAAIPPGDTYFAHVYSKSLGDIEIPLWLDEEGLKAGDEISLDAAGMSVQAMFAADIDRDGHAEIFLSGTTMTGVEGDAALVHFSTRGKTVFKKMVSPISYISFMVNPDLNADGIRELVFLDYSGNAAVSSDAALNMTINSRVVTTANSFKLDKNRPHVNVETLADRFTIKRYKNLLSIRCKDRTVLVDMEQKKATLVTAEDDEPKPVSVPFVKGKEDKTYIDIQKLAKALDFKVRWDVLTQALDIKL